MVDLFRSQLPRSLFTSGVRAGLRRTGRYWCSHRTPSTGPADTSPVYFARSFRVRHRILLPDRYRSPHRVFLPGFCRSRRSVVYGPRCRSPGLPRSLCSRSSHGIRLVSSRRRAGRGPRDRPVSVRNELRERRVQPYPKSSRNGDEECQYCGTLQLFVEPKTSSLVNSR